MGLNSTRKKGSEGIPLALSLIQFDRGGMVAICTVLLGQKTLIRCPGCIWLLMYILIVLCLSSFFVGGLLNGLIAFSRPRRVPERCLGSLFVSVGGPDGELLIRVCVGGFALSIPVVLSRGCTTLTPDGLLIGLAVGISIHSWHSSGVGACLLIAPAHGSGDGPLPPIDLDLYADAA